MQTSGLERNLQGILHPVIAADASATTSAGDILTTAPSEHLQARRSRNKAALYLSPPHACMWDDTHISRDFLCGAFQKCQTGEPE